jgi:hypothetical protein
VLVLDRPQDGYDGIFEEVKVAATIELENANPWEQTFTVTICRRPQVDLREYRARLKNYR